MDVEGGGGFEFRVLGFISYVMGQFFIILQMGNYEWKLEKKKEKKKKKRKVCQNGENTLYYGCTFLFSHNWWNPLTVGPINL